MVLSSKVGLVTASDALEIPCSKKLARILIDEIFAIAIELCGVIN